MLSDPSYKPNQYRGLAILISCMGIIFICIISHPKISPKQEVNVFTSHVSAYYIAIQKNFTKPSLSPSPAQIQKHTTPDILLNWKTEPSSIPITSPAATFSLYKGGTPTPLLPEQLNMHIHITITGATATILVTVTDNNDTAISDSTGYLTTPSGELSFPPTDISGQAELTTSLELKQTYTITEIYNEDTITETFTT